MAGHACVPEGVCRTAIVGLLTSGSLRRSGSSAAWISWRGPSALASTAALIHWFEYSTKILPFLEGVAAINLAAEGQVAGAFGPFARALERHYGVSHGAVAFWDVHEIADAEHSDVGDHIVIKHAATDELQAGVRRAVQTSLAMWWQFFAGIEQEADATHG